MSDPGFRAEFVPRIADIGAAAWATLGGTARRPGGNSDIDSAVPYNPFISYAFLSALEDSGCVGGTSGWSPAHLRLTGADGRFAGAVPAYVKAHSQGEYVFDHGWADAFQRAGGRYYPKLQVAVPFTPVTGPRLLVTGSGNARAALATGLERFTAEAGLSSAHATFLEPPDRDQLMARGWLHRTDQQYHFLNRGYRDHADFLGTLASRKRKALRKERAEALANGISIVRLTGSDLTEAVWDDFHAFYMDTGGRKWGRPYLNRAFFSLVGERMAEDIVLVMARRGGRNIAGALNLAGSDALYGRYWGAIEDHPCLHFELCYHQAIDHALERGLARVEAGAQGEHKLARGYVPVTTHSAHFIRHAGLRDAVAHYLERERADVAEIGAELSARAPFRRNQREIDDE